MKERDLVILVDEQLVRCIFVRIEYVAPGVTAYIYNPIENDKFDVARVKVEGSKRTPLQRVLGGVRTIERFDSGDGVFLHSRMGVQTTYRYPGEIVDFEVQVGDEMQWQADNCGLIFIELCWPPFSHGRFLDL